MNVDQDRPYVCNAPGCSQRFQREDHLIIHRHKHEMTLKFPSIKFDSALSDQTPTPTRFLRNCEEVGLFSDLELDQTAEEEEDDDDEEEEDVKQNFKVQCSSVSSQSCNDGQRQHPQFQHHQSHQSHQPHQSQQPQQCSLAQLHPSVSRHTTPSTTNTHSAHRCLHSQPRPPAACALQGTSSMHMNAQLSMDTNLIGIPGPAPAGSCPSHQRSKVTPSQTHLAVSNGNQNPMGHMMGIVSSQHHRRAGLPLTHLPAPPHHSYPQHCHSQSQPRHAHHQQDSQEQPPHSCAHHSPPAHLHPGPAHLTATHLSHQPVPAQVSPVRSSSCSQSPPQTSGGRRRRATDSDPDERRKKFLERNRAAASRCRQKRKVWVSSLERKAEELTHTNLQLQNEVTLLRSEVTQLKQLLVAHKDCPVTARQETQGGSPTRSPIRTHGVQHNSISTSSISTTHTHLTTHTHTAS
ncbi:cyclic AMP-responsive element-binding protein 5 [Astyanax mexicanus]|uniref:cyclic AMP-responsive element-binding protein 5 n=1 Tax=Astyanax mexicanus TaxID=7994 RepID=UPI0020CADDD2|nr:cyclic AMP-responsive element-binding protein 5 [Astyanax mexicanus]